jgi:RimJ/RimL family protein N-acetyltransferase
MTLQEATVCVTLMKNEDAESLSSLFRSVVMALPYYNEAAKRTEIGKHSADLLRASAASDPGTILVAKLDAAIVGFCLSRWDDDLIWLSWFGVHPNYRRKGIASTLLVGLEDALRKEQIHKIWCDCRTENQASIVVLTKQGYSPICTVRNHWYGQDYILWEKLVG